MESSSTTTSSSTTSTSTRTFTQALHKHDVLCGRGGLSNNHLGNRIFRRLVHVNKPVYQQTSALWHKQNLVTSIIEAIHNQGGRFVKKEEGNWVEISRRDAAIKTSQALRESLESSEDHSSSSSPHPRKKAAQCNDTAQEQRQEETIISLGSISLAQTLFEVLHTRQGTMAEASVEADVMSTESDDFEPISLDESTRTSSTDSEEEDFEPIQINQVSATENSPDLDELIFGTIGDMGDDLFEGFAI